jgi:hypothetical protein
MSINPGNCKGGWRFSTPAQRVLANVNSTDEPEAIDVAT